MLEIWEEKMAGRRSNDWLKKDLNQMVAQTLQGININWPEVKNLSWKKRRLEESNREE